MKSKTVKPVRFGDQIEIEIDSMAFGGDSVGRYKDMAIFVRGALPGERVLAKITSVKDHYASAEVAAVLRASADRVEIPCKIFEQCGGCQWQHFDYPKQLQTKTQFVKDSIERIGKLKDITVNPCLPSPNPYAYRNKALPVLSMRDDKFVAGIYEPRSHQLVPYETCPIQTDAINDTIRKVLDKIDRSGLTPYQEKSHTGFLRHLAVRHGTKTGEILLAFVTRTEVPEDRVQKSASKEPLNAILPRLAQELIAEVPGLVGVLQNVNPSRTNIVFGQETKLLAGRDHYFEIIDGFKLKVSLQSFLQVNTAQADQLHETVRKALGDPFHKKKWGTVLDLYSGIGTLALGISGKADYVTGVEEIVPAVEDAKINAKANHRNNLDFVAGDVPQILLDLRNKGLGRIDAAILDPPRKGVSPEVLARVVALHPERIVYVSCDPSTLARDLAILAQHGFNVEWAQPLDMFPQTYHVETVVRLTRDTPLPPDVSSHSEKEGKAFRLERPAEPKEPAFDAALWKERSQRWGLAGGKGIGFIWAGLGAVLAGSSKLIGMASRGAARGLVVVWDGSKTFIQKTRERMQEEADRRALENELKRQNVSQAQLLSNAIRLADLELQLKDSLTTAVKERKANPQVELPVERIEERKPLAADREFTWPAWLLLLRWPKFSFPLAGMTSALMGNRLLRLACAAIFLTLGGYLATAKIAPILMGNGKLPPNTVMLPDMVVVMPTRNYLRYEMVPFEIRVDPKQQANFSEIKASVLIYSNDQPITTVGGMEKMVLKKDPAERKLTANWPIPYNPKPGTYVAELTITAPEWKNAKLIRSAFTISPLRPQGLYPGYATLTMEGGKQLINGAVPAVDGTESMKPSNAIGWAKFMGANCYCFLAGQTSVWDHFNSQDFPFNPWDLELAHKYGKAAHEQGVKFAAYITTFKVVGDAWEQAPYQFATGYDKESDQIVPTRFISIEDKKRRQDVIDILKKFDDDSSIDIIGLDYVRTGYGGYEMVEEFMNDLTVPEPPGYADMTKDQRILWLARTVEHDKDHQVTSMFEWWRAHKVALTLKGILDKAKVSKPVFSFTLGWQQGHQHGQDPAMFVDAGVNYNHIMLYEGDADTLKSMNDQWPGYLSRGNGMYAPGEMVDFNWVQKSLNPPGPEELYNREIETFSNWFDVNARLGMFWHDLYRLVYGIKGPYSSMEWTIAGAKAFSDMKNAEGVLPIKITLDVPREAPAGVAVPIGVEVRNESNQGLKGLVIHQLDTTKNYASDIATVGPFELPAGHTVKFKNLTVTIPKDDEPERDNRFMTAVLVEQPDTDIRAFDFSYVHRLGAKTLWHIQHATEVKHHLKAAPVTVYMKEQAPAPVTVMMKQAAPAPITVIEKAPPAPPMAPVAPAAPAAQAPGVQLNDALGGGDSATAGQGLGNSLNDALGGLGADQSSPAPAPAAPAGSAPPASSYDQKLLENSILEQLPK